MLIMIPIEPIPMRYSVDWLNWFTDYFHNQNIDFLTIQGKELTKGIEQGRFLDCIGTNYYKSSQLMNILEKIQEGEIKKGDTLFFLDIWFPGIEQIKYTSDLLNLNLNFGGCLHAGAYDPNDMLYQKGLGSWAIHFEHSLFALVDKIFVATHFHKDLVLKSRSLDPDKIKITGFPFIPRKTMIRGKKNQIVFPHRLDDEKNPHMFESLKSVLKKDLPDWELVYTAHLKDKDQYYSTLEESKIAISFSDQETWGIAMMECVIAGCIPLVPNKLSYKEMYLPVFKYDTVFSLKHRIVNIVNDLGNHNMNMLLLDQILKFENQGSMAFKNITRILLGGK